MFMDAPNKICRDSYETEKLSKFMLNFKFGSCILGAVFLLSSCVGEQSSLELNNSLAGSQSGGLNTQAISVDGLNTYQTQTSANTETVSPYPPGSPIPIKAPRQVAQTPATPVTGNAEAPIEQTPSYVSALAVPIQNPKRVASPITNAIVQPSETPAVMETSLDQEPVQATQVAALDPSIAEEAPKDNFFTRLANSFKSQQQPSTTSVTSSQKQSYTRRGRGDEAGLGISSSKKTKTKQRQLASLSSSSTGVSTNAALIQTDRQNAGSRNSEKLNALPGVKSNNEIFGIEEHGDEDVTQVAALGGLARISPNGLRIQHEKVQVACLKQGVLRILKKVERRYGKKPIITSGYRSPKRNRRAGGARNSQHIYCKAVDIQVEGVSKWNLAKYLRTIPGRGGVGTYCRTKSVHIDIGSKRDWHSKCRRSSVKKRKKRKST